MERKVFLSTSPEPEGVASVISKCFDVPADRVTYDGELEPCSGFLFTVDVTDADTDEVCRKLSGALGKMGFTTKTMFKSHRFRVEVFKKHYRYAYAALALTVLGFLHFQDVHKKSFERIAQQWIDSAWRYVVFHLQSIRIPDSFDEWRHINSM